MAILEYDYRSVGDWMVRLRKEGVTHLSEYMDRHPEELAAALLNVAPRRL